MYPDPQTDRKIRRDALNGVYESDMLEWYRQQYNLPLDDEKFLRVTPEAASLDYYRRQFYWEIQYGVRKWGEFDPKLQMPPLPMLKPFGGILPVPNGYGYTDDDTIDNSQLQKQVAERERSRPPSYRSERPSPAPSSSRPEREEPERTRPTGPSEYLEESPNLPPHLKHEIVKTGSNMVKTEDAEYGMSDEEFWRFVEIVEKMDAANALAANKGEEWEVVESLRPSSNKDE